MPSLARANEIAYAAGPYYPRRPRSWTSVTVSKVLHRLSPNIPIIDSRVKRFYGTNGARDVRIRMNADLATSAEEAQRQLTAHPYKVVVAAWSVSGPEVMETLRATAVRPIVILIVPAHTEIPADPTDMVCLVVRRPLDNAMVGQVIARCIPPQMQPPGPEPSVQLT